MSNCKYETKNGRCSLKDSYAYRHKCYTEESCKCHEAIEPCGRREPMTNADRIRAMTDEELAKECVKQFPMYLWPTDVRTIYFDFDNHNKNNAINAWIKWLKQPAEGDA